VLKPRRQRENVTLVAREKALLARFAKDAGGMVNIHDLKAAYGKAIGHKPATARSTTFPARHGWRELMPSRPFHLKRDLAAQHDFKKALSTRRKTGSACGRPVRSSAAGNVCHKAHFGRMNG
jgi:hypothetical protein